VTLVTIPAGGLGGVWIPHKGDEFSGVLSSIYTIDALNERVTVSFRAPRTGTLTRFETCISAVGNSPNNGLKLSFQQISASDGMANGTILGGGAAHITTAANTPSAAGWLATADFGAGVAVTAGDPLACVIEFGGAGWVTPDNVSVGYLSRCGDLGFPFGTSVLTTKQNGTLPIIALRYSDGTYAMIDEEVWPAVTQSTFDMDTGSAQNEAGLRFTVPAPMRLSALDFFLNFAAAGADFEVYLYAGGSTLVGPISHDGDHSSTVTGGVYYLFPLPTPVVLKPNTEYIVGLKPTTTNNVRLIYYTIDSLALMDAIPGGSEWYAVARAWSAGTPGSWARYQNGTDGYRRPRVFLCIDQFDYSARGRYQIGA